MNDAQLINRLKNASTDAVLSGDHVKALWLSQAAARLTELSIIHHTWHPSIEEVTEAKTDELYFKVLVNRLLEKGEPRMTMYGKGWEIALRVDGIYFEQDTAFQMLGFWSDLVRELREMAGTEANNGL